MKKILALCLAACLMLSIFTSCEDDVVSSTTETTAPDVTYPKTYNVEDGILMTCIGQADENGVFVVPDGIVAIAEGAFTGDDRLKEVKIGADVKMIGSGAFQNCSSLRRVEIAEGVEEIGSYAFYNCSALESVSLPSTVSYLNQYTFYGCAALENISLEHIRYIDDCAFWYCVALENVTLSSELTHIGSLAFSQCSNLSDINIAELTKLETIDDYAFSGCAMMLSITIPDGVKTIGNLVFHGCTRLSEVEIPASVEMVGFASFNYTPWYQENDADYLIVGDGVLIKCAVHPTYLDLSDKNIKTLGGAVFWNATNDSEAAEYGYKYAVDLENVVLPDTITTIGTSAFAGCYNLKNVTLPENVVTIDDNAFNVYADGYQANVNVDFSKCTSLETIGDYAFHGCGGIETMELPKTVTFVGEYAFAATGAYENFMAQAAKATEEEDRYFITGDGILLAAYVANGQTAIHIPEGVKMIAGTAFCGWDTPYVPGNSESLSHSGRSKYNITFFVTEVQLPSTLEVIGNSAFFRMTKLTSLVLPASLKSIGMDAFAFCDNLASISGGDNVKIIGDYAFRYCVSLPAFQFSSNTETIGYGVFSGCSALKTVRLPRLAFPGDSLFNYECTSLMTLYLDDSARPRIYSILGDIAQEIKTFYYEQ